MSADEIKALKNRISDLEEELVLKKREVIVYQKELIKFSQNLDMVLSASQQDVKTLNQFHHAIVPTELPQFPGFEISRKFTYGTKQGGDYFDIFQHEDKMKFGVMLASSSGYAASAAFLSVILQQSHILDGKKEISVSDSVEIFATHLQKIMQPADESQIFYAVVDRRHMTMEFVCMGKIIGLIQSLDSETDDGMMIISSDTIGVSSKSKLDCTSLKVDLNSGHRICVVSEGLNSLLDQDELVSVAEETGSGTVHELRNQIFVQAQLKSGLDQPIKDQTVIVIEVKDNLVRLAKK